MKGKVLLGGLVTCLDPLVMEIIKQMMSIHANSLLEVANNINFSIQG